MSKLGSMAMNMFTKFCQQGVTNRADFIKNVAVIGWVLSSLAQSFAILFNDKIPSKEKRFLIPQEIFDGLINATLFWFITSKANDLGKLLVLKKHILPKSIAKVMETFKPVGNNIDKLREGFFAHLQQFGKSRHLKIANLAIEGMSVFTGLIGAVISNNIVTPLLRNKLAGIYQKQDLKKVADNAPLNPYYGQLDYSKYDFSKLASAPKVNTFRGFYSGSTKI